VSGQVFEDYEQQACFARVLHPKDNQNCGTSLSTGGESTPGPHMFLSPPCTPNASGHHSRTLYGVQSDLEITSSSTPPSILPAPVSMSTKEGLSDLRPQYPLHQRSDISSPPPGADSLPNEPGCSANGATLEVHPSRIPDPVCTGMMEHPSALHLRSRLRAMKVASSSSPADLGIPEPLFTHLSHGLAYTVGSALGSSPPSTEACLEAFTVPNKAGLTAGGRAWSKHAHRSLGGLSSNRELPGSSAPLEPQLGDGEADIKPKETKKKGNAEKPMGWWGTPSGPVSIINERSLLLFWKVMTEATWRNLHWLPHFVLAYEVRVQDGYGMRWSQDQNGLLENVGSGPGDVKVLKEKEEELKQRKWVFRGCVEPMMENGHEVGWRH